VCICVIGEKNMGRSGYQTCMAIIQELANHGDVDQVPENVLVNTIKIVAGNSHVTVRKYMKLLVDWSFVKKVNSMVYIILKKAE